MSAPLPTDLGKVITSATVRKVIYTVYVVGIVFLGAIQVGFAATDAGTPAWLTVALAVAAYLGVPVAGLAAVNATAPAVSGPSRDQILSDLSYLDPDEQNTELQAARARVEG
ncbi:MAG: hypothetical protein BGN97_00185 [Microbacterium sp. 69-10]|uniref:hypothetical protein n=1 Tax=Microbacterium sp. 69-10 TaxID=1895783 RepID=UPI00095FC478|nr:hypothetical protein [Microbacterium sp. 69-10]OJU39673.1 MAG: hypothetical protein BGN97_00185 [Microbacterium sp. 69-10]